MTTMTNQRPVSRSPDPPRPIRDQYQLDNNDPLHRKQWPWPEVTQPGCDDDDEDKYQVGTTMVLDLNQAKFQIPISTQGFLDYSDAHRVGSTDCYSHRDYV